MSGFIAIHRNLFDHEFFDNAPMSEREAWMWMLATARWKDSRHKVGLDMFDVPRGSFMVTLREMQSRFMWGSDTKVRNFLKRLGKEGMIERTTVGSRNAPKTHITICNYSEYQVGERTENVPKTHHERTKNAVKKQGNKETREKEQRKEPNGSKDLALSAVNVDADVIQILSNSVSPNVAASFVKHRRDLRKPMTDNAANAMLKKLEGHQDPDAVLTDSIANGWQGIFPEKTKGQNNGQANSNYSTQRDQAFADEIFAAARAR